jgi:phosphotriesterase-related protein
VDAELKGKVMTVTGPVEPSELGVTNPHEHLIIDFLTVGEEAQKSHQLAFADKSGRVNRWDEPLSLRNYYEARRNPFLFKQTLQLTNVEDAAEALEEFKAAGGGCVCDVTPIGVGRDPQALRALSERTGVKVVMGTGFYVVDYHPADIVELGEVGIYERIVEDLENGSGDPTVRPGIIGEIGLVWPVADRERTVLSAAARAQANTGYCLTIHPGRDPAAPLEAIRIVEQAGGDPARTIIDHLDRTIFDLDDYLELARTGCYLELDLFGLETSYYPVAELDMPNDAVRVEKIVALAEQGHLEQILVSHDVDTCTRLTKYGGEGYQHILENVTPIMRRKGLSEDDVRTILEGNPQRALTIV